MSNYFGGSDEGMDNNVVIEQAIDSTLLEELEKTRLLAQSKTLASLVALTTRKSVVGFDGVSPFVMPSFISLQISGLEIYSDLFLTEQPTLPEVPEGTGTVYGILQFKLSHIRPILPLSNCLVKQVVHRPRFRSIGITFFEKVNRHIERECEWVVGL
jgi:hypothetical protein